MAETETIGLLGLGEVGGILAADLAKAGARLRAFDPALSDPASRQSEAADAAHVTRANAADGLARGATLVVSAVTAAETLVAARSVLPSIAGCFFLDLNSAAPETKREAARAIETAGGHYVEAAVMSPFPPKRLATPMLLGGPHATGLAPRLAALGFNATVFSPEVGRASSVKMCRSVMVKGLEALFSESLLSARHYGVEADVLASLKDTLPGIDLEKLALYMIGRTLQHGKRRAEEMREVAITVQDAGYEPWMSRAIVERQAWAHDVNTRLPTREGDGLGALLDAMRAEKG